MKFNKWTLGLAAVGVVSLASAVQAAEKDNPVKTALSSTTISGYVDTSYIWHVGKQNSVKGFASPGAVAPGVVGGNGKADGFNLNVVKLTIESAMDESEWAAGYKVDMLMGPDAVNWNPSPGTFGVNEFGLKQAYVALRAPVGNGINFKVGTFDTIIGYEVFESGNNPNYSRSYGWGFEPTQHTGVLASYNVMEGVSLSAGVANSAGTGINARAARAGAVASTTEKTYMAGLALTAPESWGFLKGSTLYAGMVDGLAGGTSDNTWLYVGTTMNTPVEGLAVGAAFDTRLSKSKGTIAAAGYVPANYFWSVAGYTTYQATEKFKLAFRGEYANSSAGLMYAVNPLETDPKNSVMAFTLTADYSLWQNVISRLEVRWDHDLTGQSGGSVAGTPGGPFGQDDQNNLIVAANLIYNF